VPSSSRPSSGHMGAIPVPRAPRLALEGVRRDWFAGNPVATAIANAVNLLFPSGERFFIRSVRHYRGRVSPALAAQVKGFFGQEGRHAQAHERLFDTLRAQGLPVDALLETYEGLAYRRIEKLSPPAVNLAVTVALEHFTAIMAEDALDAGTLEGADPEVRQLLEWHAVEELEHKAVAFDVLQEVAPGYVLRVLGMVLATLTLGGFWVWATRRLLAEQGVTLRDAVREMSRLRKKAARSEGRPVMKPIASRVFVRGIREYLRPGFHPMDRDHSALVERTLTRLSAAKVIETNANDPATTATATATAVPA
jgi:uncharacterized protein